MSAAPAFLVTIDTEGDNLWAVPETVTTDNARWLPRFQELCERHGVKPTWLTDYEMAECPAFLDLGRDVLRRRAGEIGMHLHAWNSPPVAPGGPRGQAYLIEYPDAVMRDKIRFMTDLLEQRFGCKMKSHRAGRWALDRRYARLLAEHGYVVDCSVTPHVSWRGMPGDPDGAGGTDYTAFPARPYFMDLDRIDRAGDSALLEVPMTIVPGPAIAPRGASRPSFGGTWWLRPNGGNLPSMLAILDRACAEQWPCVEFMLHSSELMPGGSPTFPSPDDIAALYEQLEVLLGEAGRRCRGQTLGEFRDACGA
jgi:hypothetical protein